MTTRLHPRRGCGRRTSSLGRLPVTGRRSLVDVDDAEHLSQRLQFVAVTLGDPVHRTSPSFRQMHLDISTVCRAAVLRDELQRDAGIDERGGTVRACLQPMRQFANGGPVALRIPDDVQQHQVLRLGQTARTRGSHAEALEARDLVAEL